MANFAQNTKQRVVLINNINLTEENKSQFIDLSKTYSNVIFLTNFNSTDTSTETSDIDKSERENLSNIFINGEEFVKVRGVSKNHDTITLPDGTRIKLVLSSTGFLSLETVNDKPYFGVFYEFDEDETLDNKDHDEGIFNSITAFHSYISTNDAKNIETLKLQLGDKNHHTYILVHNSYIYQDYSIEDTSIGENYKGLKTIDSNITFYQNINEVDSPVYLEIPHKIIKNDFTLDQPIFTNLYIKNKYYSIYRIDKEYCGEFTIKFNKDIQ